MNAKKGASTSKKLTSFFTQKPRLSQPQDISKKQLWHGFYQRHVTFREGHCTVEVDISLLLEDNVPGKDMNTLSWYSDRHYKVDEKTVGTFRSPECAKIGFFEDNTCVKCAGIPKLQSFRKRALLRHKNTDLDSGRTITFINHQYLTETEKCMKLSNQALRIEKLEGQIFFSSQKQLKLKLRKRSLTEKLAEFSSRGSLKGVCQQLIKASMAGHLDSQPVLLQMLRTVARNLNVSKFAHRYHSSLQMFYEVILLWGGPRLAQFVAMNLAGPEIHSVYRWRKAQSKPLSAGLSVDNFNAIAPLYSALSDMLQVPVLFAEDETAIIGTVQYVAENDTLSGFCGEISPYHQCADHVEVHVGPGEEGYQNIMEAFQTKRIGMQARAIILNPLHPDIPKIPILIQPTCNRFDATFVSNQWGSCKDLYQEANLHDILEPAIGHSSDGDSRRRSLMITKAISQTGDRHQPIPREDGFIFTAEKIPAGNAPGYNLKGLMDQDYVHNHKKLVNHLFHVNRDLRMGPYVVHSNHIRLACERLGYVTCGLGVNDVERKDRQNWRSAQKLCFEKVQASLQRLIDGNDENRPVVGAKGTLVFLKIIWFYVEIFISSKASLLERIKYAGLVTHFLAIWRNFIIISDRRTLSENFLTRETFTDVLLSTHFAVSLITYMRDAFPDQRCHLELTGTDVVETFWSMNGQWVGNRHNYDFTRLQKNLSHMIRLEEVQTNPQAPKFARPHPKGEIIWPRQYADGWVPADLADYPAQGEEIVAWRDGIHVARQLAHSVGMLPEIIIQRPVNLHDQQDVCPHEMFLEGPAEDGGVESADDLAPDNTACSWALQPLHFQQKNLAQSPDILRESSGGPSEPGDSATYDSFSQVEAGGKFSYWLISIGWGKKDLTPVR